MKAGDKVEVVAKKCNHEIGYYDFGIEQDIYTMEELSKIIHDKDFYKYKFCPDCGKKLDWKEIAEIQESIKGLTK